MTVRRTAGSIRHGGSSRLLFCLTVCVLVAAGATARGEETDLSFVDAHVHLNRAGAFLDLMDAYEIPRAVVFWGRASDNETLVADTQANPTRFIPFASVSPERRGYRPFWEKDDPSLLAELDELLAAGIVRGIGEISVAHFPSRGFPEADFDPLGNVMTGIMALARKHRVPVSVHCELTRLREFSELLERFPDVAVIWAHGGYTPYFLAKRMIARHPNLIYELSARTWSRHPRSPDYTILRDGETVWPRWITLVEENPTRFVVGSDASQRSEEFDRRRIESVRRFLWQLSPETRRHVAHVNIESLLER